MASRRVKPAPRRRPAPIVAFSGPSGAGRPRSSCRSCGSSAGGGRVAAIKHSGHPHGFDAPGKDTDLLLRAGAASVVVQGTRRWPSSARPARAAHGRSPGCSRPSTWSSSRDGRTSGFPGSRSTGGRSGAPSRARDPPGHRGRDRRAAAAPAADLLARRGREGWPTSCATGSGSPPCERRVLRYLDCGGSHP